MPVKFKGKGEGCSFFVRRTRNVRKRKFWARARATAVATYSVHLIRNEGVFALHALGTKLEYSVADATDAVSPKPTILFDAAESALGAAAVAHRTRDNQSDSKGRHM